MWVIEEYRRDGWARICQATTMPEALSALRLLRSERPWRHYRLASA